MVKQQYDYIRLECWEHTTKRRFGVKRPFICLKADTKAVEVVLLLLDELSGLQPPAQRVMTLLESQRPRACSRIRFSICPVSDELTEMSLSLNSEMAEFEFTQHGLERFREAIELWKTGREDFCVRPSQDEGARDQLSGEVWFWTQLEP